MISLLALVFLSITTVAKVNFGGGRFKIIIIIINIYTYQGPGLRKLLPIFSIIFSKHCLY
jgi:hypothetical protein